MSKNHRHHSNKGPSDKWYLVARFTVNNNDNDVYFVKTQESSRGHNMSCTCDGYAANLVNGIYACRHTDFCINNVVDFDGGILIDKMPPRSIAKSKKLMDLWVDRHVKTYTIDKMEV